MAISPSRTVTLTICGPLERADLPGLFERTCALLETGPIEILRCEVAGVAADAVAVDALARLALAARRAGCQVRLCGASEELRALVELSGLADVLQPRRAQGCSYASSRGGRPNSGKIVSVARKKVNSTIRPSATSSTCSAHGS